MPNKYVFPGGALQTEDFRATRPPALLPDSARLMGVRHNPDKAQALANAALRETYEETGLLLGAPQPALRYIGRATTPRGMPLRFNARFFVARYEWFHGRLRDTDELSHLAWFGPEEWQNLPLVDITAFILQNLTRLLALPAHSSFIFRRNHSRRIIRWLK